MTKPCSSLAKFHWVVGIAIAAYSSAPSCYAQTLIEPTQKLPDQAYNNSSISGNLPEAGLSSLSLERAMQLALQYNHDLKLGKTNVDNAEAATTVASAAPNPNLTIQSNGINPRLGIGAGSLRNKTIDSTLRIDQLIERGGKRDLRIETATHLEKASRLDFNDTRRQLKQMVSAAYYDLLAAQHKLRISQENSDSYQATLNAANKRKKSGDISGADVARVRIDALRAENDLLQSANELKRAQSALALLMGIKENFQSIRVANDWPATDNFPASLPPDELIQKRSDVAAAKARLEAALTARKLALAAKTRDITVGLQFEHYPTSPANQLGSGNSYGISVQIPLFTRYEFQGEIRAAEVAVDVAQENLAKTTDAARSELNLQIESLQTTKTQLTRVQNELLPAARKSAEATEFAFKNGAVPVMDVLDARRTYRSIELDAIYTKADLAKAGMSLRISLEELEQK